ncbi:hypothetical protein [Pandoraea sp. NPDC087047]|uniref:hypothetical protein n=1 Tax=Pandoraea sp. NPDC087047 TaxID=3364390 RepID=UPI003817A53D
MMLLIVSRIARLQRRIRDAVLRALRASTLTGIVALSKQSRKMARCRKPNRSVMDIGSLLRSLAMWCAGTYRFQLSLRASRQNGQAFLSSFGPDPPRAQATYCLHNFILRDHFENVRIPWG